MSSLSKSSSQAWMRMGTFSSESWMASAMPSSSQKLGMITRMPPISSRCARKSRAQVFASSKVRIAPYSVSFSPTITYS